MLYVVKNNLAAGVQLISLNTLSNCYHRQFFCQIFTKAIDSIVKYLHIFINSSLAFSTKLFIKPKLQQILLSI